MDWDTMEIPRARQAQLYYIALEGKEDFQLISEEEKSVVITSQVDSVDRQCGTKLEAYISPGFKIDAMDMISTGFCMCEERVDYEGNPSPTETAGVSLLHVAAAQGHINQVRQLLDLGCNINNTTLCLGRTALHMALSSPRQPALQLIEMLLDGGVDVAKADAMQQTALHMAVENNFPNIIPLLAAAGCPIDAANGQRETALSKAVQYGHVLCVKELVNAGASVNIMKPPGWTPLLMAVRNNQTELIKILVRGNCDVNLKCYVGTALHHAAYRANVESVRILLEAGANPDVLSQDGHTPLTVAAYNDNASIAELLLAHNCDVNLSSVHGYMPLHFAAWEGHTKIVKMLLEAGAMYDLQTEDRNTPLALACHGNQLDVIKCLLPLGCNVNNTDKDEDTPIHYVTYNGCLPGLKLLLEYGANPDVENNVHATPLWNAVHMKHKDTIIELLRQNVRTSVASKGINQHIQADHVVLIYTVPRTPLFVAFDRGLLEVAQELILAGTDMSKEQWFWRREYPTALEKVFESERNVLSLAHSPMSLKKIARGYIRRYFGLGIHDAVHHVDIPTTLKEFLLLKYLH